ncbi:precursor of CEP5-like [Durio zibethinus]|uniref:Precursor of CEP5-like n=1 Tax=Durio zibethinus TaxID=66656 RepID=A0A6P6BAL1_DURZI|nr:precursor of CEP5-like [Durio zibethinus]
MAQKKLLSILVLLLFVFVLEIQCVVGRHLIFDRNQSFQKVQTYGKILAKETGTILDPTINGVNINKAPVANTQSPPLPPRVVIGETQAPPHEDEHDYRPTTPRHSPGVGHSLQN